MRTIYFIKDEKGFKYTACMFANRKAAQKHLNEMQSKHPDRQYAIDTGLAFSE